LPLANESVLAQKESVCPFSEIIET